jgi:hypothetical protein
VTYPGFDSYPTILGDHEIAVTWTEMSELRIALIAVAEAAGEIVDAWAGHEDFPTTAAQAAALRGALDLVHRRGKRTGGLRRLEHALPSFRGG